MSSAQQTCKGKALKDKGYLSYKQDTRSTRAEDDSGREFRCEGAWELVSQFYLQYSCSDHQQCLKE